MSSNRDKIKQLRAKRIEELKSKEIETPAEDFSKRVIDNGSATKTQNTGNKIASKEDTVNTVEEKVQVDAKGNKPINKENTVQGALIKKEESAVLPSEDNEGSEYHFCYLNKGDKSVFPWLATKFDSKEWENTKNQSICVTDKTFKFLKIRSKQLSIPARRYLAILIEEMYNRISTGDIPNAYEINLSELPRKPKSYLLPVTTGDYIKKASEIIGLGKSELIEWIVDEEINRENQLGNRVNLEK